MAGSLRRNRRYVMLLGLLAGFGVVLFRLVTLQVLQAAELTEKADRQHQKTVSLEGARGTIVDRNGKVLAMNLEVPSVFGVPTALDSPAKTARSLSPVLHVRADELERKLGKIGGLCGWRENWTLSRGAGFNTCRWKESACLTFSGGEPMEQAAGLATVARLARAEKDLNIICFTGYQYECLVNYPPNDGVRELLAEIDVLIDRPYIQSKNDATGLRGSNNQRIIHLTSNLEQHDFEEQKRKVEITLTEGQLEFIGIPSPAIYTAINQANLAAAKRTVNDERI